MSTIEVDESTATHQHRAEPDDRLVIRLPETPTSGYRWQLDTFNEAALEPAGDEFVPAADAGTGGGGIRELHFLVRSADQSRVALSLRRPWETETAAAQRFETTIN